MFYIYTFKLYLQGREILFVLCRDIGAQEGSVVYMMSKLASGSAGLCIWVWCVSKPGLSDALSC